MKSDLRLTLNFRWLAFLAVFLILGMTGSISMIDAQEIQEGALAGIYTDATGIEHPVHYKAQVEIDFEEVELKGSPSQSHVSLINGSSGPRFEQCDSDLAATDPDEYIDCLKHLLGEEISCPGREQSVKGQCRDPKELERIAREKYRRGVIVKKRVRDDNTPAGLLERYEGWRLRSELGSWLRLKMEHEGQCPMDAIDLSVIREIVFRVKEEGLETPDVSLLLGAPRYPESSEQYPSLALACGINLNFFGQGWHESTFHCTDSKTCFNQGLSYKSHDYGKFVLQDDRPFFKFEPSEEYLDDYRGYYDGFVGEMALIPLGSGVFIYLLEYEGTVYYYGLVFAPTKTVEQRIISKKQTRDQKIVDDWEDWFYNQGRYYLSSEEFEASWRLIFRAADNVEKVDYKHRGYR